MLKTPKLVQKKDLCEICSSALPQRRIKFCSQACRDTFLATQRVEMKCQYCQKLMVLTKTIAKTKRHCSKLCYDQTMASRWEIITCVCGKVFTEIKARKRKYCSTKCMYESPEWRKNNNLAKKYELVKVVCKTCQTRFYLSPSRAKPRIYCSIKCRSNDPELQKRTQKRRVENIAKKRQEKNSQLWIEDQLLIDGKLKKLLEKRGLTTSFIVRDSSITISSINGHNDVLREFDVTTYQYRQKIEPNFLVRQFIVSGGSFPGEKFLHNYCC